MLSLLACVLIFLCGTLSFAQQAIPVSIVNLSGLKVPELTTANFVASYNGKAVQVESASPDNNGRRIVLLLDVSDSMLGRTSDADWNFPLDVADHLLAAMPPSTAIGLAAFGTGLEHVMSPTNDRTKLKDEVEVVRKARWSFSNMIKLIHPSGTPLSRRPNYSIILNWGMSCTSLRTASTTLAKPASTTFIRPSRAGESDYLRS